MKDITHTTVPGPIPLQSPNWLAISQSDLFSWFLVGLRLNYIWTKYPSVFMIKTFPRANLVSSNCCSNLHRSPQESPSLKTPTSICSSIAPFQRSSPNHHLSFLHRNGSHPSLNPRSYFPSRAVILNHPNAKILSYTFFHVAVTLNHKIISLLLHNLILLLLS